MPRNSSPSKYTETAQRFVTEAKARGYRIEVRTDLVCITKTFAPGDRQAFVECDCTAPGLLGMLPMTYPGSTWGTDGGSVGGHSGLTRGEFYLNKSGIGRNYLNAIRKVIGSQK